MIKLITEFPVECKICGRECCSPNSLSAHLIQTHNVKSIDYTLKYLLNDKIPVCKCGCNELVTIHKFRYSEFIRGHNRLSPEKLIETGRKISKTKKINKYYEYSSNPENWKIDCDGKEGCIITSSRYEHFRQLCIKKELGIKVLCISCVQTGKIVSEEFKEKCRNRIISDETKKKLSEANFRRYANMSPEEREIVKQKQTEANLKAWANASPEKRAERLRNRDEAMKNLSPERILQKIQKIGKKARERMELQGGLNAGFAPGYNPETIPYIVDILNAKYDTEFRHAESKNGEFKIYDKEFQKFYYADAYCQKLNIWVEFDEDWHFKNRTELNESCQIREERIRKLLDCQLLRIQFSKKIHNNIC